MRQISEIAKGGAADLARNAGHQIRTGDYVLYIDGWSCSQRHSTEVPGCLHHARADAVATADKPSPAQQRAFE